MSMRRIELNELPAHSRRVYSLLRGEPSRTGKRNVEQVREEYDHGIYHPLLEQVEQAAEGLTPEDVLRMAVAQTAARNKLPPSDTTKVCISLGDEFFETDRDTVRDRWRAFFLGYLKQIIGPFPTVAELGAGYGLQLYPLTLSFPGKACIGGELSDSAVALARLLFRRNPDVSFHHFNFYEPECYRFLGEVKEPVLVYTSHAIEQLPSVRAFIDNLAAYRNRIGAVVHFEPVYQPDLNTVTGLMRARYIELADYNRDLLTELAGRPDIRIRHKEMNVIGENPLNPTSIIHWEFET